MIKVKRGSTKKWTEGSGIVLEPGQPGYDKTKHKLKIGDGKTTWSELSYTSGLFAEEILSSEKDAKEKKADYFEEYGKLPEKDEQYKNRPIAIITYGEAAPNANTVGQIYLQPITEPEVDFVIASGITESGWTYQKWKSGIAKCWCNYSFKTTVKEHLELFCQSTAIGRINYPFTFVAPSKDGSATPTETATLQSSGGQVLLANSSANTAEKSGTDAIWYL